MTMRASVPGTDLEIEADPTGGYVRLWHVQGALVAEMSALTVEQFLAELTRAKDIVETGIGEMGHG
jgi:hypothetical protein